MARKTLEPPSRDPHKFVLDCGFFSPLERLIESSCSGYVSSGARKTLKPLSREPISSKPTAVFARKCPVPPRAFFLGVLAKCTRETLFQLAQLQRLLLPDVIGDSASQALAEFLLVLVAVVVFQHRLVAWCSFQVRSNSTAALSAWDKLANTAPTTNFSAAELALRLEMKGIRDVDVLHVRGALNMSADWFGQRPKRAQRRSGSRSRNA